MTDPKPPDETPSPSEAEHSESSAGTPAEHQGDPPSPASNTNAAAASQTGGNTSPEPAPGKVPPQPETPRRSGRILAALAILIALAAAAGSGYLAWITQMASQRSDTLRADLSGDIGELARKYATLEEKLLSFDADRLSDRAQFDESRARDRQLSDRLDDIQARTDRLAARGPQPESVDWRLAEVEYLLRIANRLATLGRSRDAALAALTEADGLLLTMDDPSLQPLRSQLADDILALRSMPRPDIEGLALRLVSLSKRVDSLPLAGQRQEDRGTVSGTSGSSGWARLKSKVSDFFAGIFRVRQAAESPAPLLSPEESFFLRRSLELELQAARIAVLTNDLSAYRASLGSARRWTEEYFDRGDAGVRAFVSALGELEDREIESEMPDISGSLQALLSMEASRLP